MAEKLISYAKIDKLLKSNSSPLPAPLSYSIGDETIEITVKNHIDFSSIMSFVDGITDTVFFIDDDGETHYIPAILEYAKALHYIEYFTNLKPEMGAERTLNLIYNTPIYRDILSNISQPQYNHLEEAIDSAIEYRRAVLVSGERIKIAEAADKIEQASLALESLTNQFDGVGDEKLNLVFDRLASIDNEGLVEAVTGLPHKTE